MKTTTKNITIGVVIVIAGIIVLMTGLKMYNFRINGGYSGLQHMTEWVKGLLGILICFVEWILSIIGMAGILFGGAAIWNNAKKLMR